MSSTELITLYLDEPWRPNVIDLSGGRDPDLTPEWVPWMMQELVNRDLGIRLPLVRRQFEQ